MLVEVMLVEVMLVEVFGGLGGGERGGRRQDRGRYHLTPKKSLAHYY